MQKSKRTGKRENTKSLTETSKTSLRIEVDSALRQHIRSLSLDQRQLIGSAINQAAAAWGQPHLHSGTGIRKLTHGYFECRSGLKTRLVFKKLAPNALHFFLLGNHNDVQR